MTMSRIGLPMLLLIGLLASGGTALGQGGSLKWHAAGPWGENVYTLAIDPTNAKTIYAGARVGLYRSTDGGTSWTQGKGIETSVLCVAVDPKSPKTVYAGGYQGGIFRSTDGGATWKNPTAQKAGMGGYSTNDVERHMPMHAIAIDPVNTKKLFASSLYESTDGGASWKMANAQSYGGGIRDVNALAIDPKNPKIVFSGDTGNLHRSTDGGATWAKLSTGLGEPAGVGTIEFDPKDSRTVFVGSKHGSLRRSTDGGGTWGGPPSGLEEKSNVAAIAVDPSNPKTVYVAATLQPGHDEGSIFRSSDGGATFEEIGAGLPVSIVKALVLDKESPKTLYAGTDSGVFRTTDGGQSWGDANSGFGSHRRRVNAVAGLAGSPRTFYVSAFEGLYRSTDDGKSWTRPKTGADKQSDFHLIAVSPEDPGLVIAADEAEIPARSGDHGETWSIVYGGPYLTCLTNVPGEPRSFIGCEKEGGLVRTVNGGESWKKMGPEDLTTSFSSFLFDPTNRETMLASVRHGGLMRSTNAGKKWKEINKGITIKKESMTSFGEFQKLFAMTVDPSSPKTFLAATGEEGIWKTTDAGETWRAIGLGDQKITCFLLDPTNPKRLVAGTAEKGVFVSTDGGGTWAAANAGLEGDALNVTSIAVDRGSPARIYLGTRGAGAYWAE